MCENHLNLAMSSLASLPFPLLLIISAKDFAIFFLTSVQVAFLTTLSDSYMSIFTFSF